MNFTATATAQRQEPVYPELTPQLYQTAVTELADILRESAAFDEPDALFLRLQNWGIEVINTPITEDFQQKAAAKIDELRYEILADPFDLSDKPRLVVEPLYDGEWIWSKPTLNEYLKVSRVSPFTPEMVLQPKAHKCAQKICVWLKEFLVREPDAPLFDSKELAVINKFSALSLSNPAHERMKNALLENVWQSKARAAKFRRDGIQQRKIAEAVTKEAKEGMARCRELLKQEAELLRQEREEHEQKLNERIATVEQNHQAQNDLLQTQLNGESQKLKATEQKLDKAENDLCGANQRISHLNAQIQQQAQQIAAQNGGGGFCTIL